MKQILTVLICLCFAATSFAQSKPSKTKKAQKVEKAEKHDHSGHDHSGHDHSGHKHQAAPASATTTPEVAPDPSTLGKMVFTEEIYEYGTVTTGDVVSHTFNFTNEGAAPLIITGAKSTCGCTVPTYPKTPILPGEAGEITVRFNTKGKSGRNRKPVNITANTWPVRTTVYIDGTVQKPEVAPAGTPAPKVAPSKGY